ncbi:MAG TPA: glycosyltransferase [Acidimicrobiales bacterium]|nr:glycosyltransferase [Acidimicrobiales bacterium]
MTPPVLRRLAAVGLLVTAFDVAVLAALRVGAGLPPALADALAVLSAALVSRRVHRRFTFADEPRVRWVEEPGVFVRVTLLAAAVDVAVLSVLADVRDTSSLGGLLPVKAVSLATAAAVRALGYRAALQPIIRAAQRGTSASAAAAGRVRLSIVVPTFREESRIASTVARLRAAGAEQVLVLPENRGKGAAVRAGMLAANGRTIVFTDADLAYPPEQIARVVAVVEAGADVVIGSRRHVDTTTLVRARRLREVTGRLFNLLTFVVLLGQYRDTQCGLKGFRRDAARLLFSRTRIDGFAFDVEVLHLAERYRLTLREVPVELANTSESSVRVGRDSLRMLWDVFRIRRLAARGAYGPDGLADEAPN